MGALNGALMVQKDLDAALTVSYTYKALLSHLRAQGYELRLDRKHPAVRPPGGSRFIRLNSLGSGYTEADLKARVREGRTGMPAAEPSKPLPIPPSKPMRRYRVVRGVLPQARRRPRGFRALYLYYIHLLTAPRRSRRYVPFQVRKEALRLERYKAQFYLLRAYRVDTPDQLAMLTDAFQAELDALTEQRKGLYRQQRRGREVSGELEQVNARLRQTRRRWKLCVQTSQDQPVIRQAVQMYREEARSKKQAHNKERRDDRWM